MNESGSRASGRGALAELKDAVGSLVEQALGTGPGRDQPRHELRVEDRGYRVRVELPGMQRREIEVSIAGKVLSISGKREKFEPPAGARMVRRERPSGRIAITVQLPAEVDALAVSARMQEGVLEVRLPRPSTRGRSVDVEPETSGEPRHEAEATEPTPEQAQAEHEPPPSPETPESDADDTDGMRWPWDDGPGTGSEPR